MNRLTPTQIAEQHHRFETFIKKANLTRIGKTFVHLALVTGVTHPEFTYLRRVLRIAKVNSSMIHPEYIRTNTNYRDILHKLAIKAYFQNQNN